MGMDNDYSYEEGGIDYPFEETTGTGDENRIRGNWSAKMDYYLSVFGFTFALGNLWRFPNQLTAHGGVAYLVPYLVLFLLANMPVLFLESALGQFASLGPVSVWKISPLFKGVGISMVFISCVIAIYFNMITAWAMFYMVNSMKFILPWATCGNDWNSDNCSVWNRGAVETCKILGGRMFPNGTCVISGIDSALTVGNSSTTSLNSVALSTTPLPLSLISPLSRMPSLEYFHNQVLMISTGPLDFVTVNWQLAICLFLAWIFVFVCSFKGVKTSGKVVYCTVALPYIILVVLLVRFLTLPGSLNGVQHFLKPDWSVLRDLRVWGEAAVQVFYSLSTCTGGITILSSYNRFHNNVFYDIWIIGLVDFLASICMSTLVFSTIGFVSYEMDFTGSLDKFRLQDGIQLIFVFFAEALSKLPVAQLYCILFFLMVALIMFNSELFLVETVVSSICDEFPERLRRNHRHVLTFVIAAFYILGVPLCTAAGVYWIVLLEKFTATWPLIIIAFFEVMIICWIYGIDNFLDNIKWMTNFYPPVYILWKVLWKFICPLLFMVILAFVWLEYRPISYDNVYFPQWAIILGWSISLSPLLIMLSTAVYKFLTAKGSLSKRWRDLLCPEDDWGPALAVHRAEVYPLQIPEARKLMPTRVFFKPLQQHQQERGVVDSSAVYNRAYGGGGEAKQRRFDSKTAKSSDRETII